VDTALDIAKLRLYCENTYVVLNLPELENEGFQPEELRLELACALYARKRVSKVKAAALAGVDFFTFQHALKDRGISQYTETMLEQDLQSLEDLK
jgi:predicted HTH domain antitoxin